MYKDANSSTDGTDLGALDGANCEGFLDANVRIKHSTDVNGEG